MHFINDKRILGIIISTVLILLFFVFSIVTKYNDPNQKPESQEKAKWYIVFTAKSQRVTAYTAYSGATKAASGKDVFLGSVAVHPRVPRNQGGSVFEPVIPFGTRIYLKKPITVQGNNYDSFIVLDTGDVNYRLWKEYPYWIDVYWGTSNRYTVAEAHDFGIDLTDYFWIEEWR
ncbi:MAG: hypothetical protein GX808_05795 [Syntrophomonadaceae bacterium]|nr:hypothetical protein [Syntrophomonadaceae bacterium]